MKKPVIGLIYSDRSLALDERIFIKLAKKKKVKLVLINILNKIDEKEIRKKVDECDIIYNSTAEDFGIEFVKTIEEWGKKIIESSKVYYETEDKWMFYVKCEEHKIPVPKTILLSENVNSAKKELQDFGKWPVILKLICGTMGEYVDKADSELQAERIMKKFWKESLDRLPIIAQEFVESPSYRVTVIGGKIVQTAMKTNKSSWKATGVYAKKNQRFPVDKELKEIINKLMKFVKINVCGIDLLKKDGKWLVLEVNAEPGLDFFQEEREKMINYTLDLLIKLAKKETKNHK